MDRRLLLTAGLVLLVAVVAHAPGLWGGFVYDDHRFIESNESIRSFDPVAWFSDPSTASADEGIQHDIYRPVRTLVFAVERSAFGLQPFGWHAVSLLLHALASVLLLRVLLPLVRGKHLVAGIGAALYAVHPLSVECVSWVSSQGDLLAVLFMLSALIVLEKDGFLRTVGGLLLAAIACFAKESALVFPALLLLRDLALPRDLAPSWKTTWIRVALLAGLDLAYLFVRGAVLGSMAQVAEFPGGSRLAAARGFLAGLAWYASAVLWPVGFSFDLHLPVPLSLAEPAVLVGLGLFLTLVLAGAWGLLRGRRWLAFATWGVLACLVPVSGVFVPMKAVVADRFFLPAMICVAAGLAFLLWRSPRRVRPYAALVGALLVVVLVPVTWRRTLAWQDDLTLWKTVLLERPSHMRAYEGLGYEYLRLGRIHDAEIAYESYLEYNPADAKAMRLLGDAFGTVAEALEFSAPRSSETLTRKGRRYARIHQIGLYGRALSTWERVGLTVGRGSPAMRAETLEMLIEAAWDIGDLRKARDANDALIGLEGVDPADVDAVLDRASFRRTRHRLGFAWRVLVVPVPDGLKRNEYELRMRERALVLADVGVPPRLSDDVARLRLVEVIDRVQADLEASGQREAESGADVQLSLRAIDLLNRSGRGANAGRRLRDLRARYPDLEILDAAGASGR